MPTATDALRVEWGPDESKAVEFLEKAGYVLDRNWVWSPPERVDPITDEETRAVLYLVQEWDYGGVRDIGPESETT